MFPTSENLKAINDDTMELKKNNTKLFSFLFNIKYFFLVYK